MTLRGIIRQSAPEIRCQPDMIELMFSVLSPLFLCGGEPALAISAQSFVSALKEGLGLFSGSLFEPHFSARNHRPHLQTYLRMVGISAGFTAGNTGG